jgi:F1F0 ATPase subunit 2
MSETFACLPALAAGLLLGAMFFGGLWWTVRRAISSSVPAAWFLGSMLLRTSLTAAGFYYAAAGQWQKLVACLIGFIAVRMFITRWMPAPAPAAPR